MTTLNNPILEGFCPDPSICVVEDNYYIVCSSFAYFPGVPMFHSKDLANWKLIGNVLNRESQLPLDGIGHSEGIYAPTLRYHKGTYYMITTNVSKGGNFYVTAAEPTGPWSEPVWLGEEAPGIDPSLFFDTDGTCYYVGTRPNPEGVRYFGDWEIWVQKLDLTEKKLVGESHKIWKGALQDVVWPEGPHLYIKDGYYYVMIAEGGTGPNHSVTIARSKNIFGPYENNPNNPILTHRHLGSQYPVQYVGHGDLVETSDGRWYMVMLASRPCKGYTNLGRETFLAEVIWEEGWPIVNAGAGKLKEVMELPGEPAEIVPRSDVYHFYEKILDPSMVMLRNPRQEMYSLQDREGYLRLFLQPETLSDLASPSFVSVRQQSYNYLAGTMFELIEGEENEEAGLAIIQNDKSYLTFTVKTTAEGKNTEVRAVDGFGKIGRAVLASRSVSSRENILKIVSREQKTSFYVVENGKDIPVLENVEVSFLSTEIAGGFVGCTIGMYATSNGKASSNYADFAWFEYKNC